MRLLARAPLHAVPDHTWSLLQEVAKLKDRAKRFNLPAPVIPEEEAAKKAARAARFNTGSAGTPAVAGTKHTNGPSAADLEAKKKVRQHRSACCAV